MEEEQVPSIPALGFASAIVVTACTHCGVLFGLTTQHVYRLSQTGRTFYCPNGHRQNFTDTPAAKCRELAERLEKSQQARQEAVGAVVKLTHENDQLRAARASKAKRQRGGAIVGKQIDLLSGMTGPDATTGH
jgi:hypothetical protein